MKKVVKLTESDLTRIVKRVINENSNDRIVNVLETFLNKYFYDYDEICQFIIDPDYEDDEPIWVYMVISKDWYYYDDSNETNKIDKINQLKRKVIEYVKLYMNIDIYVGTKTKVREC